MAATKRTFLLTVAGMALMVAGATSAQAGFEFKGAAAAAVLSPIPAASMPAPAAPQGGIQWDGAGAMPSSKVSGIEAIPLSGPLTSSEKREMPASSAMMGGMSGGADVVSGFGSDLPLSVAVQQVVPPQYTITYGNGVKDSAKVSWSGDRPWKDVLADMLGNAGLSYGMDGNTINIRRDGTKSAARKAASPAPRNKIDAIPDDMMGAVGTPKSAAMASAVPLAPAPVSAPAAVISPVPAAAPSATSLAVRRDAPAPAAAPVAEVETAGMTPIPPEMQQHVMAAPAAVAMPVAAPTVIAPAWQAEKGQTLRAVLEQWSKAAQADLYWSTDYDYRLSDTVAYAGNFDEAVNKLLENFSMVKPQPYGRLHRNPAGGSVLIVNTYNTIN